MAGPLEVLTPSDQPTAIKHRHVHIIFDVNVFAILRHLSYHDELPHDIDSHGMDADALQTTMAQGFDLGHLDDLGVSNFIAGLDYLAIWTKYSCIWAKSCYISCICRNLRMWLSKFLFFLLCIYYVD